MSLDPHPRLQGQDVLSLTDPGLGAHVEALRVVHRWTLFILIAMYSFLCGFEFMTGDAGLPLWQ